MFYFLLVLLFLENHCRWFVLVTPGVYNMRHSDIKECCYFSGPEASCLYVKPPCIRACGRGSDSNGVTIAVSRTGFLFRLSFRNCLKLRKKLRWSFNYSFFFRSSKISVNFHIFTFRGMKLAKHETCHRNDISQERNLLHCSCRLKMIKDCWNSVVTLSFFACFFLVLVYCGKVLLIHIFHSIILSLELFSL